MKFQHKIGFDILFYLVLPLGIWKFGHALFGNYATVLLSTAPGVLYAIYTFIKEKQFNISGTFILMMVLSATLMDVSAGSAEQVLWYRVYYNIGMIFIWTLTMLIRRPIALYFFVDYAYYRGLPRKQGIELFSLKEALPYFYYLTFFFLIKDACDIPIKIYLIQKYGISGYNHFIIFTQLFSWVFNGLKVLAILYVIKKVKDITGNPALDFLTKNVA